MHALICVSSMPYAAPTLQQGSLLAGLQAATVTLLTVVPSEAERPFATTTLAAARNTLAAPVAETKIRVGHAAAEILAETQDHPYDLVVVGAHVVRGFWDPLVKSVPQRVLSRAAAPLLIARGANTTINRILICTNGHDVSRPVVKAGARLARAAAAHANILHVVHNVPGMYTGLPEMPETLPGLLQSNTPIAKHLKWSSAYLHRKGVSGNLKLRSGIVADEILEETNQGSYDLVVVGIRPDQNVLTGLLVGSVTPRLVDHALCSVLVVRMKPA
ncbi:MAG: universal stress protein [Anaerolineales bacterium]|nr:universal stress protein [Anaerolineales bacterium]